MLASAGADVTGRERIADTLRRHHREMPVSAAA
jgi:hypothetical protein